MEIQAINHNMQAQLRNASPAMRGVSPQTEAPRRASSERGVPSQENTQNNTNRIDKLDVGFGNNSVNVSGAALQAIDINLELSRRVVPSPEELREASLERRAEQQATEEAVREQTAAIIELTNTEGQTPREVSSPVPAPEAFRPEPAPNVNNYNNTAAVSITPTTDTTIPVPSSLPPTPTAEPENSTDTPASQAAFTLPGNRLNMLA